LVPAVVAERNDHEVDARSDRLNTATGAVDAELVEAALAMSRALVAVASRVLCGLADEVTLGEFRTLVELAARGPQRPSELARALTVDRSTATRVTHRLLDKGLVHLERLPDDRRGVQVSLSAPGRDLVEQVSTRRRTEIAAIAHRMLAADRIAALEALRAFARAAGELPIHHLPPGWAIDA
jgi:DNA-binding MarR family transcriptional regulator